MRIKHIDIRYRFVREKVEDGQVVLQYRSMKDMKTDLMTKSISAVHLKVYETSWNQATTHGRVEWEC